MKRYRLYKDITRRMAAGLPALALVAIATSALALMATGCSKEEKDAPETGELIPLVINEVTGKTWAEGTTRTTTAVETKLPTELYIFKEGDTPGKYKTYTLKDGKWSSTDPLLVGSKPMKIRAIGGFESDNLSHSEGSLILMPCMYDDIPGPYQLYSAVPYYSELQTVSATNHVTTFQMKPFYARLTINLEKDYYCEWDGRMNSLFFDTTINSYQYDAYTGACTSKRSDYSIIEDYDNLTITTSPTKILDIIIPYGNGDQPSNYQFVIERRGGMDDPTPITGTFDYTPRAGEWTIMNLTIKPEGITFAESQAVKIEDFIDAELSPSVELKD